MVFEGLVGADCCSKHCVCSIDNPGLCASSAGDRHTVNSEHVPRGKQSGKNQGQKAAVAGEGGCKAQAGVAVTVGGREGMGPEGGVRKGGPTLAKSMSEGVQGTGRAAGGAGAGTRIRPGLGYFK